MLEVINGKNYAEKIAHQAVVVNVGASWCPDCRLCRENRSSSGSG
ncbi:hypothetical protein [Helicobacter pylori]